MAEESADLKNARALHPLGHILSGLDVVVVPLIIIDIAVDPPTEGAEDQRARPPALGNDIPSKLSSVLKILLCIREIEDIERGLKRTEDAPEISHRFCCGQIAPDRKHPATCPEPSDPVVLGLVAEEGRDRAALILAFGSSEPSKDRRLNPSEVADQLPFPARASISRDRLQTAPDQVNAFPLTASVPALQEDLMIY